MPKLTIELTDGEFAALQRVTEKERVDDGVPDLTIESEAESAVRFLLLELKEKF
jgi:hypothetical protein